MYRISIAELEMLRCSRGLVRRVTRAISKAMLSSNPIHHRIMRLSSDAEDIDACRDVSAREGHVVGV
jgi:hypothetical protein